jgi:uncharacterized membrane protein
MELLGTGIGLIAALLWGSADIFAALAARRLRTLKTTFLSQAIGLCVLLAFGTIAFWRWHLHFTFTALLLSAFIGLFTGLFAALEIGPMAVVSPITSTSSTFALVLSVLMLQEQLTLGRTGLVTLVILGLLIASS